MVANAPERCHRAGVCIIFPMTKADNMRSFLASLKKGTVTNGFETVKIYSGFSGQPSGARFRHSLGMVVDLLFFRSVPQVSLLFNTPPVSDGGHPHALEHIVLSKGSKGKRLSASFDMSLAESTAATFPDATAYQFSTCAGMDEFNRLLEEFLDALVNPDFSDWEVEAEVYNVDGKDGGGQLSLEEKGSVYNEMVASCEKPYSCAWEEVSALAFGPKHPLARKFGGEPGAMRRVTAGDIRAFHKAHYGLGPNASLICALPSEAGPSAFLKDFDAIIRRVQKNAKPPRRKALPRFSPSGKPAVRFARFPSEETESSQDVLLCWPPSRRLPLKDAVELAITMDILGGGETSLLHRGLVDRDTRKKDFGITSVNAFLDDMPSNMAGIILCGLPPARLDARHVNELRREVVAEVCRVARLEDGSPELKEILGKAESLLISRRKSALKFADTPPRFGDRGGGLAWHKHLDSLNEIPGEEAPLCRVAEMDAMLSAARAGKNIFRRVLLKYGLARTPFACAPKADPSLLVRQRGEREARLAAAARVLRKRFKTVSLDEAIKARMEETGRNTAAVAARDASIVLPPFIKNPPLTLDDNLSYERREVEGCPALLCDADASPFTEVGLYCDASRVREEDFVFLSLLDMAVDSCGVVTSSGERLDYCAMLERSRREIYGMNCSFSSNPWTGRVELCLSASACGTGEISAAARWLEDIALRPLIEAGNSARLISLACEQIDELRSITSRSEEHWVRDAAAGFVHWEKPGWLSLRSPFTELFNFERLRWLFENPRGAQFGGVCEKLSALADSAKGMSAAALKASFAGFPREIAEQLAWWLAHAPEGREGEETAFICRAIASDLSVEPEAAAARMRAVLRSILSGRKRLCVVAATGAGEDGRSNMDMAVEAMGRLASRLGASVSGKKTPLRSLFREKSLPDFSGETHCALVNRSTKSGVFVMGASGLSYGDTDEKLLAEFLAIKAVAGGGPDGLFMKTWSAGLAYSNGINANASGGRVNYYAERCPDLVETMSFAVNVVRAFRLGGEVALRYALANCFQDYRGMENRSLRAFALANDYADGVTPEKVKAFKEALVILAARPEASAAVQKRIGPAAARVLPGLGRPLGDDKSARGFVTGPENLLSRYEEYLKSSGEKKRLRRAFPRDFRIYVPFG